jgi:membrane-associated phospholipid phosphatase
VATQTLGPLHWPYIGRDLAHLVWKDNPGLHSELVARKAISIGIPLNSTNPYLSNPTYSVNQAPFIVWTINDLLSILHYSCQVCMTGAWYTKWSVNRRLRPEAFANEVELINLGNIASINNDLLLSGVLADVLVANAGTQYLSQSFPEGAPAHPAYPSGHATFAGTGITIIKAFLDETFPIPSPMEIDNTGLILSPYGGSLFFGQELNKFASNVAIGRNWAGVHYRTDAIEGILLGEKIAIKILQDYVNHYVETPISFHFHGYMGNLITIFPQVNYGPTIQKTNLPFEVPDCCQ